MSTTQVKSPLNWTNILFFSCLPIVGIAGTVLLCVFGIVRWPTWILAGCYMVVTGLMITAGYHRLFAHKSYKAKWPLRVFFLIFGAAAFEGSALEWCCDHRNHHRYSDTEKDPYGINKGFWYAHIGWLFRLDSKAYNFDNVQDWKRDRAVRWQHTYYLPLAIIMGFLVPTGIAALWKDPLGGLIVAGALRMTFNHHCTFAINSMAHYFGKQPYSSKQTARDNLLTALVTYGEGFHNFHHQFAMDYRNGVRAFHYDPTKWLIYLLSKLGLAHNLQRVNAYQIVRQRLQQEEQQLQSKLLQPIKTELKLLPPMVEALRDHIYQMLNSLETLKKEYLQLRLQISAKLPDYSQQLKNYRQRLKVTQQEFEKALKVWATVLKNCPSM